MASGASLQEAGDAESPMSAGVVSSRLLFTHPPTTCGRGQARAGASGARARAHERRLASRRRAGLAAVRALRALRAAHGARACECGAGAARADGRARAPWGDACARAARAAGEGGCWAGNGGGAGCREGRGRAGTGRGVAGGGRGGEGLGAHHTPSAWRGRRRLEAALGRRVSAGKAAQNTAGSPTFHLVGRPTARKSTSAASARGSRDIEAIADTFGGSQRMKCTPPAHLQRLSHRRGFQRPRMTRPRWQLGAWSSGGTTNTTVCIPTSVSRVC